MRMSQISLFGLSPCGAFLLDISLAACRLGSASSGAAWDRGYLLSIVGVKLAIITSFRFYNGGLANNWALGSRPKNETIHV